jgi:hypothetical protein
MWITGNKRNEKTTVKRKTALNLCEQGKSFTEVGEIINRICFTVRNAIKWFLAKKKKMWQMPHEANIHGSLETEKKKDNQYNKKNLYPRK